jgi:hypothetical protein
VVAVPAPPPAERHFVVPEITACASIETLDYCALMCRSAAASTLFLVVTLLASSLSHGQASIVFQNGVSPSPAYEGCAATSLRDGVGIPWNPDANYDGQDLSVDGDPVDSAALLRWDLTGISGALTGVTITVTVFGSSSEPYPVQRLLRPWIASEATFNAAQAGVPWQTSGALGPADRDPTVLGSLVGTTLGATPVALNAAGVAVVQGWIDGTLPNHGFIIADYANKDAVEFYDSEASNPSRRPTLSLDFAGGTSLVLRHGLDGYAGQVDTMIGSGPYPAETNHNGSSTIRAEGGNRDKSVSLVAFDVTLIPSHAEVVGARLQFGVVNGTNATYYAYRVLKPWSETEVTWTTTDGASPWELGGLQGTSDRGFLPLASITGPAGIQTYEFNADGLAVVQSWVQEPMGNHGVTIQNFAIGDAWAARTDEYSDLGMRPGLEVSYWEGRLSFDPTPVRVGVGETVGPLRLRRATRTGAPAPQAAPLSGRVLVTADGGALADDPIGPWSAALTVDFGFGDSESTPFYFRQDSAGSAELSGNGGPAWEEVRWTAEVVPPEADGGQGGEPDAGTEGPPDAGAIDPSDAGGQDPPVQVGPLNLAVGCDCHTAGAGGLALPALLGWWVLRPGRRRSSGIAVATCRGSSASFGDSSS